ncbi:MAG: hypothetical protein C0518_12370 [Opitutus sp.]|nr:hypothetical protein [Opitutus sp.]
MKTLRFLLTALVLGAALAASATTARAESLHAVLLTASPEKGPTDPRLASWEVTLKRVLRFNSYTYQGSDTGTINAGSRESLMIGQGHELFVEAGSSPLSVRIRWTAAGRTFMSTGLVLRPGIPAVLGGPSTGDAPGEVYAVILVVR